MGRRTSKALGRLLSSLQERTKELNCLYEVEALLNRSDLAPAEILNRVVRMICPGWQYSDICRAEIVYGSEVYRSQEFTPTPWVIAEDVVVQSEVVGHLHIYYTEQRPPADVGPFLAEEIKLAKTIAERLGHYILFQRLRSLREEMKAVRAERLPGEDGWRGAIELLQQSDRNLYIRISRKMLNHLFQIGAEEVCEFLPQVASCTIDPTALTEQNVPGPRATADEAVLLTLRPFELASRHLSTEEILMRVQRWILEDKASSLIKVVNSERSSVAEIGDALRRYQHVVTDETELPRSTLNSLRVNLTQRLLTEQLDFVRVAKEYVESRDFVDLMDRMILPADSHGHLGGKAAGLFLAHRILEHVVNDHPEIGEVKVPRTWYVASDALLDFVSHSDLDDVVEQKYKPVEQVRQEYTNVVQLFKNSPFPPELVKGFSMALDDLGEVPLIIRSSSLLEDRLGTAFSGKYKSLFIANQGSKQARLDALMDAVAEVYSSVFSPDPIEYRREHGLLDFNEEMGILIQQVVGTRVGKYFLPAFAGVAYSNNEFRWSPRIKREDGLIRLVPGLGTRAVDRVPDDYPILVVPKQPNLRANQAIDEVVRYSPKKVDAINMETLTLDTVELSDLLREQGTQFPAFDKVFSLVRDEMLQRPVAMLVDPAKDELVATFEGLVAATPFLRQLGTIMRVLQERLGTAVDIEFAHDGTNFYLLQCRPQSYAEAAAPAPIPKDMPEDRIVFSADRHVSNARVPNITHIVYVDPMRYAELDNRADLLAVGRAVGRLNQLLPKRQFILMGPGRWGSRGDLKLGVSVTYADITNTAMLIEIARKKGQYLPDLSFGTHFFQDLVESRISYLPLYPDDDGIHFNERLLLGARNLLPEMLPEYARLADVVRVIDVPAESDGRILRVLLNADLDEALAIFASPEDRSLVAVESETSVQHRPIQYWRWRLKMAERIAAELDAERFGVVAMYVFGSTKNATAGPSSDIDLLVHFRGGEEQRRQMLEWFAGWSLCLDETNYLRTGYRTGGLLDVHIVTDLDIAQQTSYAAKIGAITDPARELPLRKKEGN